MSTFGASRCIAGTFELAGAFMASWSKVVVAVIMGASSLGSGSSIAQDAVETELVKPPRALCETPAGRAELEAFGTPEQVAREQAHIDDTERRNREYLASSYRAAILSLGRSEDPLLQVPTLAELRRLRVGNFCNTDAEFMYYASPMPLPNWWPENGNEVFEKTFVFQEQGRHFCSGNGGCSTSFEITLPRGYQVCEVQAQPSRSAAWRTGRMRYSAYISNTNPADGPAPRARGVRVTGTGTTSNNYPITFVMDVTIRAIAIEYRSDARFERGCRLANVGEVLVSSDSPRPGREQRNVNH
jgi:hypothetical protein